MYLYVCKKNTILDPYPKWIIRNSFLQVLPGQFVGVDIPLGTFFVDFLRHISDRQRFRRIIKTRPIITAFKILSITILLMTPSFYEKPHAKWFTLSNTRNIFQMILS